MQSQQSSCRIGLLSLFSVLIILLYGQQEVHGQLLSKLKNNTLPVNLAAGIKEDVSDNFGSLKTGVKNTTAETLDAFKQGERNASSTIDTVKQVKNATNELQDKADSIVENTGKAANITKTSVQNAAIKVANSTLIEVNDCLGLGKAIAGPLEALLKKSDNGTGAQEARFYMSSRKRPRKVDVVIGKQFGLEWTDFEVRRNTVVIVHGFLSTGNETWITNMTDAFLLLGDVNVIAVDWSDGGNTYNYLKAVANTRTTGNQIATLFGQIANYTLERNGPSQDQWGSIHCVGHSLGAHICGYAANEIKRRQANWTIRRITGLDPAQPCFKTSDLSLKLDKNDAPFVDVLHTNGRFLTDIGLGLPQPIGHADYFPNGGKQQPGCELTGFTIPVISIPQEVINKAICSHGRSYLYFTDTIIAAVRKTCVFWAHPWDRTYRNMEQILTMDCSQNICSEMGINSDKYHYRGSFFSLTASSRPYCNHGYWDLEEVKKILKEDYKDTLED